MKVLNWLNYLESQRTIHGKVLFTVTELANVADVSQGSANVEIGRLVRRGVLVRYANGRYGPPNAVSPEELAGSLDSHSYVSGAYALHRHNLVTQAQTEIVCITDRRHDRSRVRGTPLGRMVFVCVRPPVYCPPSDGQAIADPEQALCDYIYLCRRRGLDPQSLVTFRNLTRLNRDTLSTTLSRYPATVARRAMELIAQY